MGSTGPPLRPGDRASPGASTSRSSPSATWCGRRLLVDHLGIERLFCVIGGSMGGMQVLQWAASYPERVFSAMPIATAARHSAQNIAFHEVGRQAIMADPDWRGGDYLGQGTTARPASRSPAWPPTSPTFPRKRCTASSAARCRTARPDVLGFDADFQVESYLRHQGSTFVDRFDANSYLYITRAMDYFDLAASTAGCWPTPSAARRRASASSRSPPTGSSRPRESRAVVHALNAAAANVSFVEIESDKGHDAFLLDEPEFFATLRGFLAGSAGASC
jgi:homoserine O-acetyltransferase